MLNCINKATFKSTYKPIFEGGLVNEWYGACICQRRVTSVGYLLRQDLPLFCTGQMFLRFWQERYLISYL